MLRATQFRVQNFKNVEDSGWIPVENVTCFVGRNESGKTTLLKALHKFNPATAEPYNAQKEFPRDRYTRDFKDGKDWPVCSVTFELSGTVLQECQKEIGGGKPPKTATYTRNYDGNLSSLEFYPPLPPEVISPKSLLDALTTFAKGARRLKASPEEEEATAKVRNDLASWATEWTGKLDKLADLKLQAKLLEQMAQALESKSSPKSADMVEALQTVLSPILESANQDTLFNRLHKVIHPNLPVFIYFENFGVLDSAIYLPRLLQDIQQTPNDPKVRTILAMFKHVKLEPKDLAALGTEKAEIAKAAGQAVTQAMIAAGFLAPLFTQTAPLRVDSAGKSLSPLPIPKNRA